VVLAVGAADGAEVVGLEVVGADVVGAAVVGAKVVGAKVGAEVGAVVLAVGAVLVGAVVLAVGEADVGLPVGEDVGELSGIVASSSSASNEDASLIAEESRQASLEGPEKPQR
jgi:hypothetical protein